jgi:drug/metabolite transporter (DMT)-like permease
MAAAAMVGVQVGASIVATRFVIDQLGPSSVAVLRYAIGALCLLPAAWLGVRTRFARRDLFPMALLGIGQFGVLIALLNFALQYLPSGRAALLFATLPLMTMMLAVALGLERLSGMRTLGVLLTITGVGFTLGDALLESSETPNQWIGVAAVLASALCGAVCSVLYRPYLRRYPTLPVSLYSMAVAVAALFLPSLGEGLITDLPRLTAAGWGAIAFLGLGSGVGYFLWLWALNHASPTSVTVFLALSPVTAALLGTWLLGELLSPLLLIGLICVAAGLWFATQEVANDVA